MTKLELFAPSTITALRAIVAERAKWMRACAIRAVHQHLGQFGSRGWGRRDVPVAPPRVEHEASAWRDGDE